MARRPDARNLLFERIRSSPPKFVHVIGVPYFAEREVSTDPMRIDHVWLTLEAPPFGCLFASINTTSLLKRDAGLVPLFRLGIIRSACVENLVTSFVDFDGFDYARFE